MRTLFCILSIFFLNHALPAQSADLTTCAQKIAKAIGARAVQTKGKTVRLDYFTFGNTEMGSVFSRELYASLAVELPKAGIALRENTNDLTQQQAWAHQDDFAVCGIYTEKNGAIEVQADLYDLKNKKSVHSVKATIPTDVLTKQKMNWQPAQFEQAKRTRNLIVEDDITPAPKPDIVPEPAPAQGDFALGLMTSKGFGHQIFTEGERMQIAVQTDRSCFLRLIYHTADGQKVLLLENEPIKKSDAGNYVTVPQEFECTAPFGVETIQLFASTELYPPLHTHKDNGVLLIDDDLVTVQTKTRGFKPVASDKKGKQEPFLKAEARLQVTTLPK